MSWSPSRWELCTKVQNVGILRVRTSLTTMLVPAKYLRNTGLTFSREMKDPNATLRFFAMDLTDDTTQINTASILST
jgi:hypothetical protein